MAKTNTLGVRLDPDVYEALRRCAERDMRSLSQLVAKIIVEWLRNNEESDRTT